MLHDRDEKYEGSDEPEYHFSDEEGGDFVDSDIPKEATQAAEIKPEVKGVPPTKRMVVSLAVFVALVYVVYKMVAPTSQVPATDITSAVVASTQPMAKMTAQPVSKPATVAVTPPIVSPPAVIAVESMPKLAAPTQPAAMPMAQQVVSMQPVQPTQPMQQMMQPIQQMQQMMQPTQQMVTTPPTPVMPQAIAPQVMPPPVQMMPMASVMPTQPMVQTPVPVGSDPRIVALQAESEKLVSQMQTDYVQKLNDFSTQNKALQDQVQILNSRMITMETQMGQLVQALTQKVQQQGVTMNNDATSTAAPVDQPPSTQQKTSYNVQAIIPGRAWLRSDSGDTLTVAEGDVVKNLGRVTKIDPYDGVVEISTGTKTISLSYGTSA